MEASSAILPLVMSIPLAWLASKGLRVYLAGCIACLAFAVPVTVLAVPISLVMAPFWLIRRIDGH